MATPLFYLLITLLAAGSIAVGMSRNRRFQRHEQRHQAFAQAHHLRLAYASHQDFTLFGHYREYPLRIEPVPARPNLPPGKNSYLKASIPLVNPNRKALQIRRSEGVPADMLAWSTLDRPVRVAQDLGEDIQVLTNDPMFAGIILTQDVKISIYALFKQPEAGILLIEDESLLYLSPHFLTETRHADHLHQAISLLCDIKDELNFR